MTRTFIIRDILKETFENASINDIQLHVQIYVIS